MLLPSGAAFLSSAVSLMYVCVCGHQWKGGAGTGIIRSPGSACWMDDHFGAAGLRACMNAQRTWKFACWDRYGSSMEVACTQRRRRAQQMRRRLGARQYVAMRDSCARQVNACWSQTYIHSACIP